ncbi:MAG: response regulator [Mediterranea sp.]|jgi:signal transduction histidine kinase/DNA-binding response OmpR family regulator/ligand-binding sensor domain-containing protein|nr:response regulator [Mediterranea sp.]
MRKKRILLLLFLTTIGLKMLAYPNMIVEHYTAESGLSNDIVNCVLKGDDGFVWFGTWYGLSSFDGSKFRSYDNHDGTYYTDIPPRKIQSLAEDKNGFLWIKTIDRKLYLFDKRHERFQAVYDDVKDYSGNIQIIKIQATPDGDILLLTKDKNLLRAQTDADSKITISQLHDAHADVNSYDMRLLHNVFSETAEYVNWIGQDYKILSLRKGEALRGKPANYIGKKLAVDTRDFSCVTCRQHTLWMGGKGGSVFSVNATDGTVNRYDIPELAKEDITALLLTEEGLMYIATRRGAYLYNIGYHRLTPLPVKVTAAAEEVVNIFSDKYDKIWFQQGNVGLTYYDPLNQETRNFTFNRQNDLGDFDVQDAGEQGIFFLTPSGETLWFDRDKREMVRLNQLAPFADDLPGQLFFQILLDRDGILWLASTGTGVYRINFPPRQFQLLGNVSATPTGSKPAPGSQGIRAIYQARNGDIWVGTRWKTLYRLDRTGQVKQVFDASNYFVGAVYHIMEDREGNLWFSTKGDGLVKAEPDLNAPNGLRFTRYKNLPSDPNTLSGNDVYYTYQDSQGRIWVGLFGGGLNLLTEKSGVVTFKNKNNGLKQYPSYGLYTEVRTLTEDNAGRIWVGTTDGLMSFDGHFTSPEQIEFETYRQMSDRSNVADNDIYVLYRDSHAHIWVSVFGGGLSKMTGYDTQKHEPTFQTYGIREGLNNDVVKSIVEDGHGHLWFTTEIGLSCFNTSTGQFRNYDRYDGFLNVELEENSALRTLGGDLWLGTKEGILAFSPDKLETQHTKYDTRIVDFKVSNRDLRSFRQHPILDESITYANDIKLKHNQSMFTIEFAALNFYNQNRVSYRYILEGYEREWHYNGKNRIASYTNVPPGSYKFRVETLDESNPSLVSYRTLHITVLPPWWFSWWANLLYVLLGIAILYFALRLAFFMMRMKNDIYIEQRVSDMKIKFFTNISHELRTPLTLIKGPIQELKTHEMLSPKGAQYVDLMEKNTDQMLQLVNQILDFRKIQNGKMRLHVSLINLGELATSFQKEFRVLSEENEIGFTFQLPEDTVMVWADREKISIVFRNILSNAFKFTPSGGNIDVIVGLADNGKRCFFRVEDSGVGIPQNKLSEIFERFSQGENAKNAQYQGTGIGLALSKEIVNLHHGEITAESAGGQGTAFTVELQLGKEHYRPSEVDFYVSETEAMQGRTEPDGISATAATAADEHHEVDTSLPTLLVVEDNKDLAQLIRLQLEEKFNIYTAINGVDGLKKVHLYHPDIVVTDQMMPEMDGLEMLQALRKDFQVSHIPVIILTAKHDEEARTRAVTLGANAYITKPFSKEYLLARIEQLLSERKLFRERVRLQMEKPASNAPTPDSYEQFLVKKDVEFLDKIHKVIEENMDDSDFNIDAIANGIGLSRSAFFKKLKSLTGLAPVDLVKEIRLNKSVELIKTTDMSVSEVAFAVGFKDSGYYSKCFKKKYNQSPREYMNEWRKGSREE